MDWWKSDDVKVASVSRFGSIVGFGFVASGRYVDGDVESEICDLYCIDPALFFRLALRCLDLVSPPWGFQVIHSNVRAKDVFAGVLRRKGFNFSCFDSFEDGVPVCKFRVSN
jgi:hypothetical protein